MANATNVLEYLANDLLADPSHEIWGTAVLEDAIKHNARPYITVLAPVSDYVWTSNRGFWLGYGTLSYEATVLSISVNGEEIAEMESAFVGTNVDGIVFQIEPIRGEIIFADDNIDIGIYDKVIATHYAVNLFRVAQQLLLRYQQTSTVSGEKKSIRLGPLAKSVSGPSEMTRVVEERINSFARFAAAWEALAIEKVFTRA